MTLAQAWTARACLAVSAIALASACSGPAAPPVGSWSCATEAVGAKQTLNTTYTPDGKTSGTGTIKVDQPGMTIDMKVSFTGTWKLAEDKVTLTEQMTEAKLVEGTMNGMPVPEELKSSMTQGMLSETVSKMKAEGATMTLTEPTGNAVLTCTKV